MVQLSPKILASEEKAAATTTTTGTLLPLSTIFPPHGKKGTKTLRLATASLLSPPTLVYQHSNFFVFLVLLFRSHSS